VQTLEIDLQNPLVVLHLHPIDPWTGRASLPPKRLVERSNVDVMQQCREPCLARTSGRLSAMRRTVVVPRSSPPSETNRWTLMGLMGSGMGLLVVT